jgi:hypothetical protein
LSFFRTEGFEHDLLLRSAQTTLFSNIEPVWFWFIFAVSD